MEIENRFHDLPPLKRFKLMENGDKQQKENLPSVSSTLPAKKRKESRDFSPFPSYPPAITTTYCLPAKKRVWAIQPFDIDLNVEFDHPLSDDENPQKEIPDPNSNEGSRIEEVKIEEENDDDDDDGIVCAICESTDGDPSDPIVLCDGCDLMVHTTCYGHPFTTNGVPEGDWFCDQCLASKSEVSCCLCPKTGGALKPTTDGRWAHVVCSLYVPEVYFKDSEGRQGIDVSNVPNRRWKQRCYLCHIKSGCAVDCSEPRCPLAFHVTCGLKEDLCFEYTEGRKKAAIVAGFCRSHTDLWLKVKTFFMKNFFQIRFIFLLLFLGVNILLFLLAATTNWKVQDCGWIQEHQITKPWSSYPFFFSFSILGHHL